LNKIFLLLLFSFISFLIIFSLFPPTIYVNNLDKNKKIIDMVNKEVNIKNQENTIMMFTPILWHYLSIEQNDNSILFIPKYIKDEVKNSMLSKIYPSILDKKLALTSVGAVPLGVEQILYEKPEIIFTFAWFSKELESIKYPGVVELVNDNEIKKEKFFRIIGDLTNKEERVDYILKKYDLKMLDIYKKYSENKKTSIIVIGDNNYFIWNKNFIAFNKLIQSVGIFNTAQNMKNYNSTINIEEIIEMNPDVIFITSSYKNQLNVLDIYNNPALQTIDAVRKKKVYSMPSGMSRMEGPIEAPLLLEWMTRLLYPKIKWDKSYSQSVKETYEEMYNYEMKEEDINQFLNIDKNSYSKDYLKIFKGE